MSTSNEYQLQLTLQTFEKDLQLNIRKAVQLYNIPRITLTHYINGRSIYANIIINLQKLTALEEEVVVREVLDLDSRRFLPRMYDMEDMANRLLATYDATCVRPYWASNFIKRQPELCIYWNRLYDYQKAQCEDPEIIGVWFRFFQNIVAKYSIIESDIWNFDETNFFIGQITFIFVIMSIHIERPLIQ